MVSVCAVVSEVVNDRFTLLLADADRTAVVVQLTGIVPPDGVPTLQPHPAPDEPAYDKPLGSSVVTVITPVVFTVPTFVT
jgi:hypothetical protein